ncbi:hypothetical protein [Hymenobacter profundi]|uniref:Lipocalin-like domain-containing protein n=1 Tax=Hymenobacter profundi TaxID=1982110 RepID=A0ABS6WYH8_9BACT|nr:hypothetical protein [Hymenobacter profundi]MBW3128267.1 hypothetical protein [Hymenobacter profundi]
MRFLALLGCFLLANLFFSACSTDDDTVSPEAVNSYLFGQLWLNSYEAKSDETPTYRLKDYTWVEQPVRYNVPFEGGDGFRFEKDGTLLYIAPGIGPGPTQHQGVWSQNDDKTIFYVHLNDNSRPDFQVQIVSATSELLRARYLR